MIKNCSLQTWQYVEALQQLDGYKGRSFDMQYIDEFCKDKVLLCTFNFH